MTDQQKVRKAFEAWASVCGFDLTTIALMPSVYRDADTCHAYDGWQAALAHASSARDEEGAVDARDAKRYRRVRSSCGEFVRYAGCGSHHLLEDDELDKALDEAEAIDQAIAGRRGDGNG